MRTLGWDIAAHRSPVQDASACRPVSVCLRRDNTSRRSCNRESVFGSAGLESSIVVSVLGRRRETKCLALRALPMTKFQRVKLPWSRFFCDLECVFTRAGCAPGLRTQHVDNIGQSVGVTVSVKTMKIRKPVRGNRPEIEQRTGELLCAWPKLDAKACRGVHSRCNHNRLC